MVFMLSLRICICLIERKRTYFVKTFSYYCYRLQFITFSDMGIEINRFQGEVDEELLCPICSSVLENPLQVTI